jgi:hypothetical protein
MLGLNPRSGVSSYVLGRVHALELDTSHWRRANVWRYHEALLVEVCATSSCYSDVLRHFGATPRGGGLTRIKLRIAELGIDVSHFSKNPGPKWRGNKKKPPETRLVLRSPSGPVTSSRRLRQGLLAIDIPEICEECGIGCEWAGKPLRLQIDHRNGNRWDDRPENLRFLCPNCHSQTSTFGIRNHNRLMREARTSVN